MFPIINSDNNWLDHDDHNIFLKFKDISSAYFNRKYILIFKGAKVLTLRKVLWFHLCNHQGQNIRASGGGIQWIWSWSTTFYNDPYSSRQCGKLLLPQLSPPNTFHLVKTRNTIIEAIHYQLFNLLWEFRNGYWKQEIG